MTLQEMIFHRKSTRRYRPEPAAEADLARIRAFAADCRPLYPDIPIRIEFITGADVRCILPWKTPHYAAVFTADRPGAAENAGFMLQQLDLYIQSLGLGACWLGMGRYDPRGSDVPPREDGLEFLILLAFGRPEGEALRSDVSRFRRKLPEEIADRADPLLEPARLAPSAVNSQPWYFLHDGDVIHAYRVRRPLVPEKMNRIDMGIALAHLFLSSPERFRFFIAEHPPRCKGGVYTGSFCL